MEKGTLNAPNPCCLWISPDPLSLSSFGLTSVTWNRNTLDPKILFPVFGITLLCTYGIASQIGCFVCRTVEGQQCRHPSEVTRLSLLVSASLLTPQSLSPGTAPFMYSRLPQDQESHQREDHIQFIPQQDVSAHRSHTKERIISSSSPSSMYLLTVARTSVC